MTAPIVLIIDHSPTQALRLQIALEEEGCEVKVAGTPEAALEILRNEEMDLAVVDFSLPGMQGDELCRMIRRNANTRNLPLMLLTDAENDEVLRPGLESGVDDALPKSASLESLLFRLKALLEKSRQKTRIPDCNSIFGKGRLLVVDDSPTYREFLAQQLTDGGYSVVVADGAESARAKLAHSEFDVILIDLVMPVVDGIQLCRELDQVRLTMRNPFSILMLTAHEGKDEMTRGLDAGADDFIGKSSEPVVLRARISALLRRKFFQEENLRISRELEKKELETLRARDEREAALARAILAEKLEVTSRRLREAQIQLIHSEKMASLGQLVAGIAHELNNPLAFVSSNVENISGWLQAIEPEVTPHLSAPSLHKWVKSQRRLADATQGIERMAELILKLRTFSRLDEGEFKVVDIHEGLDSALVLLRHRVKARMFVTKDFCSDGLLGCLPGPLNQVFLNLISNALDAIGEEGTVTLTTQREEWHFVIQVTDTGPGIPVELIDRVFDPFFTTKAVGQGMGLGLSISYSIVQAHRGSIEPHRSPTGGTAFEVRLPLNLETLLRDPVEGTKIQ